MAVNDGYTLLNTIDLPGGVGGHGDWVTYDPATATIWLAQSPDNNVVVIDTHTNTIKAVIPNIGNANGIAITPRYAFVADVTNDTVDVIDKRSFAVVARVPVTGTTPDSVVYVPTTHQVLVASDDSNVEDFINANAPFTETKSLQLQPNPAASGPDVALYVPQKDLVYQPVDNKVDVIDPHTKTIVATWNLLTTGSVKPMVYDPVNNQFLVGTTNNELLVVNGDTGSVLKTIAISGSVDEASIDVRGRLAFFGDKAGVADMVNLDTDQLVGGLPAEKNMHTLAVDPANHDVYVYENNANKVDVYGPNPTPSQICGTESHSDDGARDHRDGFDGLFDRRHEHDFLSSQEFTDHLSSYKHASNQGTDEFAFPPENATHQLVAAMYQGALGGPADWAGQQGWFNGDQHTSPGTAAHGLAQSPEVGWQLAGPTSLPT